MDNSFGKKYTFYNRSHVINFQAVNSRQGFATVNVEITDLQAGRPDWSNKTSLQLSEIDLFKVFYLISNSRPVQLKSEHHGQERNKALIIEEKDDGSCKVTLMVKGQPDFFNCSPGQWFYAKLLFCQQLLGKELSMTEANSLLPKPAKPNKPA